MPSATDRTSAPTPPVLHRGRVFMQRTAAVALVARSPIAKQLIEDRRDAHHSKEQHRAVGRARR